MATALRRVNATIDANRRSGTNATRATRPETSLGDIESMLDEMRKYSSRTVAQSSPGAIHRHASPVPATSRPAGARLSDVQEQLTKELEMRLEAQRALANAQREHRSEMARLNDLLQRNAKELRRCQESERDARASCMSLSARLQKLEIDEKQSERRSKEHRRQFKQTYEYASQCSSLLKQSNAQLVKARRRIQVLEEHVVASRTERAREETRAQQRETMLSETIVRLEDQLGESVRKNAKLQDRVDDLERALAMNENKLKEQGEKFRESVMEIRAVYANSCKGGPVDQT
ncbi:unnamed protein product (mitochondrion) [Plasmodiophora brassicae]|uniref:Uncharacterized protein n=2 Tax=Plasmodiophora brassicae TaxID=37360 RepID=A0A3P3Y2J7_PLABS|nr:unnamed protein product [Plasmodiophora brassicae]